MEQLSFFDSPMNKQKNITTILLSLQNEYFIKMISGQKKYEYRFSFPKTESQAFIYAPKKVKAIVGLVEFDSPIIGSPQDISKIYSECGDGDYQVMLDYIGTRKKAFAMKVRNVIRFDNPLSYSEIKNNFENFFAPQSYIILDKNQELLQFIRSRLKILDSN